MKANEEPKKIYIRPLPNPSDGYVGVAWDEPHKTMVEYIRTDVFIEKACDAYCKVCGHYPHKTPNHICRQACDYYKDFRNYMKGE